MFFLYYFLRSTVLNERFILIAFIWECFAALKRKNVRRKAFVLAQSRAKETGKKLLVIGDPKGGFFNGVTGADYGYGDVCVDLTGCKEAPSTCKVYSEGIETVLPKINLEEYVIFQSCVFEYLSKKAFGTVSRYLEDVSAEDMFFVQVEWWSVAAYLYIGALQDKLASPKRIFLKYPPTDKFVYAFNNPFEKWNQPLLALMSLYAAYRMIM